MENSPEDQKNRWVNAEWAKNFREKFQSTIDIKSENRTGLLADVSILLSNMHIPIHSVMAKELKEGYTIIQITVEVADLGQLTHLLNALGGVKSVFSVQRSLQ